MRVGCCAWVANVTSTAEIRSALARNVLSASGQACIFVFLGECLLSVQMNGNSDCKNLMFAASRLFKFGVTADFWLRGRVSQCRPERSNTRANSPAVTSLLRKETRSGLLWPGTANQLRSTALREFSSLTQLPRCRWGGCLWYRGVSQPRPRLDQVLAVGTDRARSHTFGALPQPCR